MGLHAFKTGRNVWLFCRNPYRGGRRHQWAERSHGTLYLKKEIDTLLWGGKGGALKASEGPRLIFNFRKTLTEGEIALSTGRAGGSGAAGQRRYCLEQTSAVSPSQRGELRILRREKCQERNRC